MRKAIKKSVRFEVFKRDNFTCQYCGQSAPDVVLHIDHINPVAGGGDNDIMNLVTSCEPCNLGKGAKPLDDSTSIQKQRAQLEELSERREQLEMMLQWREGLQSIDDDYINAFEDKFTELTGHYLNDVGRRKVKGWLKKHNLNDLFDALDSAFDTYFKPREGDSDEKRNEFAGKVLNMVPRIIGARARYADKPYMKDLFYIRAIIRNSHYCNERVAIDLIERAYHLGAHVEEMKDWAKQSRNWTNWRDEMESWIAELEAENGQN